MIFICCPNSSICSFIETNGANVICLHTLHPQPLSPAFTPCNVCRQRSHLAVRFQPAALSSRSYDTVIYSCRCCRAIWTITTPEHSALHSPLSLSPSSSQYMPHVFAYTHTYPTCTACKLSFQMFSSLSSLSLFTNTCTCTLFFTF